MSLLFDTSDFPPRWHCGTWSRSLGLLHIISDTAIFLSYVTIPVVLVLFIRKKKDVPFSKIFWLFGAFIVFCGLTHLMEAIIFYWPAYRVAGLLKLATAIVSIVTSVTLIRVIPHALQLRSPTELRHLVDTQTTELLRTNEALILANEQLERATRAAQSANRSKSIFLANMSHEIRTPMTAILGFTELLSDQVTGNTEATHAIETVRRNGQHLLHVVNDILDLSKIEASQLKVEAIPLSPSQLIHDVCTLHEGLAARKGLRLECHIRDNVPEGIIADAIRLRQILTNLVANAIKFTDAGGVRVRAKTRSIHKVDHLCIEVIDTGIGISPAQQQRIFKPFTQADVSTTRRFGGTGLGLTISRRLAEVMGGSLTLVRSRVDAGSHFRLLLPFDRCEIERGNSLDDPRNATDTSSTTHKPLSGRIILLADDGADNQKLFAVLLRNAGAKVTVVDNGRDALDAAMTAIAENRPFDVILMDMQMPVMDGYVAVGKLRDIGYTRPIVALTAHAMAGDRESCIDAGCDDYLSKPTQRSELIDMVVKYATSAEVSPA